MQAVQAYAPPGAQGGSAGRQRARLLGACTGSRFGGSGCGCVRKVTVRFNRTKTAAPYTLNAIASIDRNPRPWIGIEGLEVTQSGCVVGGIPGFHLFRRSALAIAALALFGTCAASHAADLAYKAPPFQPAPTLDWTGFYAGVGIGFHAGDITQSGCVGICPDGAELNKAFGAVTVGYDLQFANNVVIGAYAIVPFTRIDKTFDLAGFLFPQETHFAANVSARLGVTFGNWMPYLSAGVTYADVSIHNNFTNITDSNTHFGPSVGVGVEYRFSQHLSIDGKFFYVHLPKKTYDLGGGPEQFGEDSGNLLLTANYRF